MAEKQPGPEEQSAFRSESIPLRPSSDAASGEGSWSESPKHLSKADPKPAAAGSPTPTPQQQAQPEQAKPEKRRRPARPPLAEHSGFSLRGLLQGLGSFLFSMLLHLVVLITLGLWMIPLEDMGEIPPLSVRTNLDQEEVETVVLDENLDPARQVNFFDIGSGSADTPAPEVSGVSLDAEVVEQDEARSKISVGSLAQITPHGRELLTELPPDAPGHARNIVDDYGQAIDRITREIMWMLTKQKVLVIWCFDQSESMKDDQQEIRARIERVYAELGLTDAAAGDALTTAVTSYGENFMSHTNVPTSDLDEIRRAIDSVPVDPSGKEMMCTAVGLSINGLRSYAAKTRRRMALILVTDESGDFEDNVQNLEATIEVARDARCKVYVLGREAVFGYPYAFIRWRHPQTNRPHWLRIDRGPETAFVEQLQINGFRRRHDAFPSGFGPYEQSRLAARTGGIFFLLPSVESKLVRGEKRRYELEAMELYKPDLRSRAEIFQSRDESEFRAAIWGIVSDLNPYNPNTAKMVELRVHFSVNYQQFVQQVKQEQAKARLLLGYLAAASERAESLLPKRTEELDKRWQANYELLRAQLIAYQVRIYEYGSYLTQFAAKPDVVPIAKPPNLRLIHWDIRTRKETLTDDETAEMQARATELFDEVIKNHPGTPYAARAAWEKRRGFGVRLVPDYEPPYKKVTNPTPIPKL